MGLKESKYFIDTYSTQVDQTIIEFTLETYMPIEEVKARLHGMYNVSVTALD